MKHFEEQTIEARAAHRVRRKMGFFIHAAVYLMVNGGLFLMNQWMPEQPAHHLPLLGWGLGLAIHGVVTLLRLQGEGLHRQMLAREIETLRRTAQ